MYPNRLLELGPITIYTLRRAAGARPTWLGLRLALIRARAARPRRRPGDGPRHLDHHQRAGRREAAALRSSTCGIFTSDPQRAAVAGAVGRRVLRRPDPRGDRRAVVHPPPPAAAVDDGRRVRAGHRARPRRRPARLPARRLLLRQADDVPWAITFTDPFAARQRRHAAERAAAPDAALRGGRRLLILAVLLLHREARPAVPGPHVLGLHAALRGVALRHRVLPRRSRPWPVLRRRRLDVAVHLDRAGAAQPRDAVVSGAASRPPAPQTARRARKRSRDD